MGHTRGHFSEGLNDRSRFPEDEHVETRLLVLFWHLAERFGRVGAGEHRGLGAVDP